MNYEDDELQRMRARREQRRNAQRNGSSRSSGSSSGERLSTRGSGESVSRRNGSAGGSRRSSSETASRRSSQGNTETFKSGYTGPKRAAGRGTGSGSGRRMSNRRNAEKKRKRMILIAEILTLLVLVVGAAAWYFYDKTFGSLQQVEFNEEEVININLSEEQLETMKGYWNVACFGVDSRMVNGKVNVGKGTNADVNLIASVNLETGEIRLVSVFRDTYLNITDKNSYNKLNAAYALGGPEQAVKALNKNLGLNITQYATFNWKAVAEAINILGGVDIHLSESEFSWINAYITETVNETGIGSVHLTHAGDVHLDGVQAVAYGRLRMGDTDYARTERQRIILMQAFEKAKKADWATLNGIIEIIMPQLATNIKPADLIPLARNISKYHMSETAGFPSARGETDIGKIGDCVIPQTLEFNVRELHRFLFGVEDYEVPANVQEYSAHIAEVTGMNSEGKVIGHVPVDQGVSASSYIRRQAERVAQQAAQNANQAEEETEESVEETGESETDESGAEEETFDPEEEWLDGEWDEEWFDDEWENEDGESRGPGTAQNGPGASNSNRPGSQPTKPGSSSDETESRTDRTTEADPGNGPAVEESSASSNLVKPGTTRPVTSTEEETKPSDGNNSSTGNGSQSPGGNNSSAGNGSQAPGGNSSTTGNGSQAPGGNSSTTGNGSQAPGGNNSSAGNGSQAPGGNSSPSGSGAESSSDGPGT